MLALTWNDEVSAGDILATAALLATGLSVWFAGIQLRDSSRGSRTTFLLDLTERYFMDSDFRRLYYKLDYHQWKWDEKTFPGSEDEPTVDRLIYLLDLVGQLVRTGQVTVDDARIMAFQAERIVTNPEIQKYLLWLDKEYQALGFPVPAHADSRGLVDRFRSTYAAGPHS